MLGIESATMTPILGACERGFYQRWHDASDAGRRKMQAAERNARD